MNVAAMPLKEAYPFGKAKGLEEDVEEIRNIPITWERGITSSVRRGAIVKLFRSHGIFDEFVGIHWPDGKTPGGQTRIRWYSKVWDEYQRYQGGDPTAVEEEIEAEQERAFAYESDLRNYLAKNLEVVEKGLRLYKDDTRDGIEYPVGRKNIDILAVDQQEHLVVIELKVLKGYERVIGQLLYYMGWVEDNLTKGKQVRGMIIGREISDELKLACKRVSGVEVYGYELQVRVMRA